MFCPKCGAQISDGAAFCPKCGAAQAQQTAPVQPAPVQPVATQQPPAAAQPAPQQQSYQYQQAPAPEQPVYQQQSSTYQAAPQSSPLKGFKMPSLSELFTGYNRAAIQYAESTGLQMKWYKALTVVLLYLGALTNFVAGFMYLTGSVYLDASVDIYAVYPALHFVDVIYGIACIALALAVLYIRMRLAQFGSDAPRLYLTLLIVNVILGFVYSLLTSAIVGNFDTLSLIGSAGVGLGMFGVNRIYFEKRQHLFTM